MAKGHRSQIKKERNIATQEKRPHATAKYVGIPAPKAKIVLDQIKGKDCRSTFHGAAAVCFPAHHSAANCRRVQ